MNDQPDTPLATEMATQAADATAASPAPSETPPARDERRFKTITLEEPIKRGETEIATLTLRKPQGGELRGLSLENLMTTDVVAIMTLIPRISDPILTDHEVRVLMDPADIAECGGAIRGFFISKGQREMMEKFLRHQAGEATSPT